MRFSLSFIISTLNIMKCPCIPPTVNVYIGLVLSLYERFPLCKNSADMIIDNRLLQGAPCAV